MTEPNVGETAPAAAPSLGPGSGPLAGKVAIVTGASRGIGYATALALAQAGAHLMLTSRAGSQDRLESLQAVLAPLPVRTMRFAADMARDGDLESLLAHTLDTFGRVDVLVNNAGLAYGGALHEMTAEQLHDILAVNLYGTFRLCQLVLPHMLAQKAGHIVFISSATASISVPGVSVYSASKAAIRSFAACLRREVAASGVRVSVLLPGMVRTGMVQELLDVFQQEDARPRILEPLLAVVDSPEVVGAAVVALLLRYRRERWLGGGGVTMGRALESLMPGMVDRLLARLDANLITDLTRHVGI